MKTDSEPLRTHIPCPHCGSHDALTEYTDGHTYCYSCETYTNPTKPNKKTKKEDTQKMSGKLLTNLTDYPSMAKRKLTEDTLRKFEYKSYVKNGNEIIHVAPYYDKTLNLKAQHLRGADKHFSWRGDIDEIQLFGQKLWSAGGKRLTITEGEIDAMTVSQIQEHKWAVVSIPSGVGSAVQSIKDNLEWVTSFEKVVLCFDSDEQGQKAAKAVAIILPPGKALIAHLPLKDPSDMLQAGRTKELVSCLWNASEYRPDGILDGTTLWEELIKDPEKGIMTPYPELNTATQGIRKGELWLFTAGSGIGKSTIVHEIGYKMLMEHNLKIGVMALEESKRRTAERYVGLYLNTTIHLNREGISEAKLKNAYDKTIGQQPCKFVLYDHFGSTQADVLINKMRYMFTGLGVDIIILDHISITVSGLEGDAISEGERRTLDILMTKLRSLVEETGKTIIAISHLKRPETGKSWNEGREPRLTDLRGSASLEQLSDVVIALHRDQTDEKSANDAGILVLKNRPVGITGTAGRVHYDPETGRLLPLEAAGTDYGFTTTQTDTEAEQDF